MSDEHRADDVEREEEDRGPPASEKQLNYIKVLQKQINLSDEGLDRLVDDVTGAALDDLSKREASDVISEIKIKAREMGLDPDAQPAVSDKQVGFIKSLKRRALLTDAEFADLLGELGGVAEVEDLGRRDASKVIDELLRLEKQGGKRGKPVTRPAKDIDDDDDEVPF